MYTSYGRQPLPACLQGPYKKWDYRWQSRGLPPSSCVQVKTTIEICNHTSQYNKSDDKEVKELDSDLVISDLEPGAPEDEDEDYVPAEEFEEEVDFGSYLKDDYYCIS